MSSADITLTNGKEVSIIRKHPWIFSGAVKKISGDPQDGDWVRILNFKGEFLGCGHYQDASIKVRLLSDRDISPDQNFWNEKIATAVEQRRLIGLPSAETDAFRLVYGEGDLLPGLIVDFYKGTAVVQCHSIGMHLEREKISQALQNALGNSLSCVYDKSRETLPKIYASEISNAALYGEGEETIISENGCKFKVNWSTGQKTGFFLDQRDNREILGRYAAGRSVLNTFCYSGGFSAYARQAGATKVDSVDVSKKAIALTDENMKLNEGPGEFTNTAADTFDFIKKHGADYDIVILDPPAFAKHRDVRHRAVIGYKKLNALAMKKIRENSLLFTFSCTQVVDRELFENTIRAAAIEAGRNIKILQRLGQPADHPVNIFHPEGSYLKGLILLVE